MNRSDDELVSSVLDGEATAAERAHVEADPVLRARLAQFRSVRDTVAEAPVPDDLAARARAHALAVFAAEQDGADAALRAVAELPRRAPAMRRGRPETRRGLALLGAAAAVLVVLIGLGAVLQGGTRDDGDAAAGSFAEADTARGEGAEANATAGAAGATTAKDAAGASPREATTIVDLGAVGDLEALRAAWRASIAPRASAAPSTSAAATAPASSDDANPRCRPVVGRASLAGRPVLLVADGASISVVDATTCAVIGTFPPG